MPRPIADSACPLLSFRIKPEQAQSLEAIWKRTDLTKSQFYRVMVDNFIARNIDKEQEMRAE